MLLIDGKLYEPQVLPMIYFGPKKPLAYVLNAKAACTLALHFLFYANHSYRYFDVEGIHFSHKALNLLMGPEMNPRVLNAFYHFSPHLFSFVRNPLRRLVSAFRQKIFTNGDPHYLSMRDHLTAIDGIDLSPEANPAQSCLAFAKWIAAQKDQMLIDRHFRPQYLNLQIDSRLTVDTILRLEDRDEVCAFLAQWIGAEKAQWFVSLNFNAEKYSVSEFVSDELEQVVREIYAEDYKLFYA